MTQNSVTTQSQKIFEAKRKYTPGGINSFTRATNPPLVISRAKGAYLYDADNNQYIDYHAAFGPIILGHCHPTVNRAVTEAISRIDLVGIGTTELELDLAAKIAEHVPSAEMVHLCNTGTEATYNAVRLARAVTGRKKLLKFQGCFHGSHDYLCMNVISPAELMGKSDPCSAGMLPESVAHTVVAEFNNLADVESILEDEGGNVAAIILEPIAHNIGCVIAQQNFLKGLRRIADEGGIVLIFDEVITGFRHGLGGYQAVCGVTPDLTTLGKSMANGFPSAAICGKKQLMERFSTAGGDVIFAGTYNGNPAGTAASLATIAVLENDSVYKQMFGLGQMVREKVSETIVDLGIKAFVAGFGTVFVIYFMDPPANSYTDLLRNNAEIDKKFRRSLIDRGIMVNPYPLKRNHISAAHSERDVLATVEAIRASLIEVKRKV